METLGTWGKLGLNFIEEVGKDIIDKTGERRSTNFLFQSISIAVQRGNAISILGTLKQEDRQLEEVFIL